MYLTYVEREETHEKNNPKFTLKTVKMEYFSIDPLTLRFHASIWEGDGFYINSESKKINLSIYIDSVISIMESIDDDLCNEFSIIDLYNQIYQIIEIAPKGHKDTLLSFLERKFSSYVREYHKYQYLGMTNLPTQKMSDVPYPNMDIKDRPDMPFEPK